MIHTTKFISKKEVARGTMAFHFERPAGFDYRAGQTIDLTLINPPETDAEGNTRTFSLASAPYEPELMIATRMRDTAFKRVLGSMAVGTEVKIDGPIGSMTLHHNVSKPAAFFAGGIGITPFRSIILQAVHEQLPHGMTLFYSNRTPEDAPFLQELQGVAVQHPKFQCVATMTDDGTSWSGERGYIDADMVQKYLHDLSAPIFYLAGPPSMVAAMYQMLVKAGVDSDNIRSDEFSGY